MIGKNVSRWLQRLMKRSAGKHDDRRENADTIDGTAGPVRLSPEELSKRLPVWQAISELWLDRELTEADVRYLAGELATCSYSLHELEDIYLVEIAPVVHGNLRQVAGVWDGFDAEWLQEAVLRHLAEPHHRTRALRRQSYMTELVAEDWQRVKHHIEDLRHSNGKA